MSDETSLDSTQTPSLLAGYLTTITTPQKTKILNILAEKEEDTTFLAGSALFLLSLFFLSVSKILTSKKKDNPYLFLLACYDPTEANRDNFSKIFTLSSKWEIVEKEMSEKEELLAKLNQLIEKPRRGVDVDIDAKTLFGGLALIAALGTMFWNIATQEVSQTLADRRNDSDQLIQLSINLESTLDQIEQLEKSINSAISRIEDKTDIAIEKTEEKTEDLSDRVSEIEKELYRLQTQN